MSQNTSQQLVNIAVIGTWFEGDGMANLKALCALQNQRAPLVLADGYGNSLGQWTVKRLQEKQGNIIDDSKGSSVTLDTYSLL